YRDLRGVEAVRELIGVAQRRRQRARHPLVARRETGLDRRIEAASLRSDELERLAQRQLRADEGGAGGERALGERGQRRGVPQRPPGGGEVGPAQQGLRLAPRASG